MRTILPSTLKQNVRLKSTCKAEVTRLSMPSMSNFHAKHSYSTKLMFCYHQILFHKECKVITSKGIFKGVTEWQQNSVQA